MELPKTDIIWKRVVEVLGENENEYWKLVDIRVANSESEYNFAINKLIECDRSIQAIELINMALYQKMKFEKQSGNNDSKLVSVSAKRLHNYTSYCKFLNNSRYNRHTDGQHYHTWQSDNIIIKHIV